MADAGHDDVARVGQVAGDSLAPARWGYRVEIAGEDQHGMVGGDGVGVVVGYVALRPEAADAGHQFKGEGAEEIGVVAAALGVALGTWVVLEFGPSLFPVTKKAIQASSTLAWQLLLATPVFAAFASFIPAMLAVSHDPAETLRED